jgi:hypothetical protein
MQSAASLMVRASVIAIGAISSSEFGAPPHGCDKAMNMRLHSA